jgi:HlyD family secretion protein
MKSFARNPVKARLVVTGLVIAVVVAGAIVYVAGRAGGPTLRLARVERGPLVASVSATGTLNAVATVQVGSQVTGRIQEILVDFNSPVRKGQLIARIDPESFEARRSQARSQLEAARAAVLNQRAAVDRARADAATARATLAVGRAQLANAQVAVGDTKRQLDRRTELLRRELIAQSEHDAAQAAADSARAQLDAARAQVDAQGETVRAAEAQLRVTEAQLQAVQAQVGEREAALRQAEVDLANTRILAPVDGVVVSRNMDPGQTVVAALQSPILFSIAQDLTQMQVHTSVDEADVGDVRPGQRATFTVDAFRGQTFAGEVVQVRKAAQVSQGVVTYVVVVSAPNPALKLLPGMTANVRIVIEEKARALKVPNTALRFQPPVRALDPARDGTAAPPAEAAADAARSGPADAADGTSGRVWIRRADGRLHPISVRLGVSDGTFTEVLAGELAEGQEVVVGLIEPSSSGSSRSRLKL